jgi:hypothetical protein
MGTGSSPQTTRICAETPLARCLSPFSTAPAPAPPGFRSRNVPPREFRADTARLGVLVLLCSSESR